MAEVKFETDVQLDKLLTTDPKMKAKFQRAVRRVLVEVRNAMRSKLTGVSTKAAHLAIRKSVYKKILGGNVNIASSRFKSGKTAPLPPVRHQLKYRTNSKGNHRGGNRILRSKRTEDLLTYWGSDRGFILRFLNSGTPNRDTNGIRNVGQIAPRHWFGPMSEQELEKAAMHLDELMTKIIEEEFNKE